MQVGHERFELRGILIITAKQNDRTNERVTQ
jgi:hypothetical protein